MYHHKMKVDPGNVAFVANNSRHSPLSVGIKDCITQTTLRSVKFAERNFVQSSIWKSTWFRIVQRRITVVWCATKLINTNKIWKFIDACLDVCSVFHPKILGICWLLFCMIGTIFGVPLDWILTSQFCCIVPSLLDYKTWIGESPNV